MQSTSDTTKSIGNFDETAISSDVDFLGDLYTQSTSNDALNNRSKFLPKAKTRKLSKMPDGLQHNLGSSSSLVNERNPAVSCHAPSDSNGSNLSEDPVLAFNLEPVDNSSLHGSPVDPSFLTVEDPEDGILESEILLTENNFDSIKGHGILDGEEAVDLSTVTSLVDTCTQPHSNLACSSGKFHPKLSSRRKDQQVKCVPSPSGSFHPDTELPECQNQTSGFQHHVDSSSRVNGYGIQPKHAEKLDFLTESLVPGVGERNDLETAKEAPRKSSRLRKNIISNMFARDEDEEAGCNDQSGNLSPCIGAENEMNNSSLVDCTQETSRREKASKTTKKPLDRTEKSTWRRKRSTNMPSVGEHTPAKKNFIHSTRRTRRQVDKKLLETPEEEIDVRKLRLKDLILLTEARERMSAKAGTSEPPPENRSYRSQDLDHGFDGENDYEGYHDTYNDEAIPEASTKYNYHTHMKRTQPSRWTKMETGIFYQAIRQFGTDFSMIQQLFPGRSRRQVILKFKNEERKYPLQIADAITNRSKDYSHFEEVIQRLQAQAEEAKKEHEMEGEEAESQDDATGGPEESEMKKSDGDDQDENEMDGYKPAKYDDYHESFDWERMAQGYSPYMGKDGFDYSY